MRIGLCTAILSCSLLTVGLAGPADASIRKTTNIPAEPLSDALRTLAKDRQFEVLYRAEIVRDIRTEGAIGDLTNEEALKALLKGTGLEYKYLDGNTVTVFAAPSPAAAAASSDQNQTTNNDKGAGNKSSQEFRVAQVGQANTGPEVASDQTPKKNEELTEIVVTGTHIRGAAPAGSALTIYTQEDFAIAGAATVDQFARTIPQNFASQDQLTNLSSGPVVGVNQLSGIVSYGGSGFNLLALGPGSTLTLLNGHRITPAGSDGTGVDIGLVPLAAIDHIEVLADGASAIYGSDAVAGVVNLITRKDFNGVQSSVRYGTATSGGGAEITADQTFGKSWTGGNALVTYEFDHQNDILLSDRSYSVPLNGPQSLLPGSHRNSVLATGEQQLGIPMTLSGTAFYSDRSLSAESTVGPASNFTTSDADAKEYGGQLGLSAPLGDNWRLAVDGDYSRVDQFVSTDVPATPQTLQGNSDLSLVEGSVQADGSLFALPGGSVKASVGVNYRHETLTDGLISTSPFGVSITPSENLSRSVWSTFQELYFPIVSPGADLPLAREIDVSVAGRYDHYSDFGGTYNPKVGAEWSPVKSLKLRASFGKSFRAPTLKDLSTVGNNYLTFDLPNPASTTPCSPPTTTGCTDTLLLFTQGLPGLRPERSQMVTAGFGIQPESIPGLSIDATYFHVNYTDRIALPPVPGNNSFVIWSQAGVLAPYFNFSPTLAQVTGLFNSPFFIGDFAGQGASGVKALFYDSLTNVATETEQGVQFSGSYKIPTTAGDLALSLSGNYIGTLNLKPTPASPTINSRNVIGEPTAWTLRGGPSWRSGPWTAAVTVNFKNAYANNLAIPETQVSSWTTADVFLSYKTSTALPYLLRDLTLNFTATNITNAAPPGVVLAPAYAAYNVGFDATNASPIGRFLSLQLTKSW